MFKDNKTHFSFKNFRNYIDDVVREDQEKAAKEIAIEKRKKAEELAELENNKDNKLPELHYKNISPEEWNEMTQDPSSFYDAIAPDPLSPEYAGWAKRLLERNGGKNQSQNPATAIANQAANKFFEFENQKIKDAKKHESTLDRLNRRLFENRTFGRLNGNKALTDKEYLEIFDYRALHDFNYLNQAIEDLDKHTELSKEEQEADLAELLSHKPKDYLGLDLANRSITQYGIQGTGGMSSTALSVGGLAQSAYGKSFASDFIIKTNQSQAEISSGLISRANELQYMAEDAKQYVDLVLKYADNLYQIRQIQIGTNYGKGDTLDSYVRNNLNNLLNELLKENQEIRSKLSSEKIGQSLNNLSSWGANNYFGQFELQVDRLVDNDLGGIRRALFGLDDDYDDLNRLMQTNNYDKDWYTSVNNRIRKIYSKLNHFKEVSDNRIKGWQKDYETDIQDIRDWKTGNNFLKANALVDDYYKAQEQILQNEQYSWKDPVKMAAFGWSGIAGGSNSSWWKSGISLASSVVGYTYGFGLLKNAKLLTQGAAILTNFEAQKSAGSDENNIEASNKSSDYLRRSLINKDLYDNFIKEGFEQLSKNKKYKDLSKLGDSEEVKQYITDAYLAGVWHSTNPEITKSHRDAIVGNNNLFYSDQPVNTTDALVGSLVSTARLEPIRELALGTKIQAVGRLGRMKFAKTAAGLRYAGFKEGVHGVTQKALSSEAGRALTKGLTKARDGVLFTGRVVTAPVRYANKSAKWIGRETGIARKFNDIRRFATSVPSRYLKAAAVGKKVGNVAGRMGIDTMSEMLQEGVQGFNAYKSLNDEWGYNQSYNVGMAKRVFDDLITGGKAAWYWVNQNDPAYYTDADVVPSMNATPLLTLFGPNTVSIFTQANQVRQDFKAIDAILHNLDVMLRTTNAELVQGEQLAKLAMSENKETTILRFKDFKRLVGNHKKYEDRENAYRRLNKETLLDEDETGIPTELIDEQYRKYEDIYSLAHSEEAQVIAQRAGINLHSLFQKPSNSEKYSKLVSLLNYRINSRNEAYETLRDTDAKIQELFGTNILQDEDYYDDDVDQNAINEDQQNAKALASLYAMYLLYEDYSKLELTGKDHSLSNHFKILSEVLRKALEKRGIDVNSKEDIVKVLESTSTGSKLLEMLNPALLKEGINISNISMKEILDGILSTEDDTNLSLDNEFGGVSSIYRERHLLEYDALLQQHLLKDFERNPNGQLSKYNSKLQSDKNIEAILEEDYVNSIRRYEDAAARDVKDNDIFVGNDGYWYITHCEKQKDGTDKWTKRRYHPNTGKIDPEDKEFNLYEYNDALTERENALKKLSEKLQLQSPKPKDSTKTTTNDDLNKGVTPTSDENEGETIPQDDADKKQYTRPNVNQTDRSNEYVKTKDINGNEVVGRFAGFSQGYVLIENPNGDSILCPPNALENAVYVDSFPKELTPKYNVGDKVLHNGKVYKVDSFSLKENEYTYWISGNNELINTSESEILEYNEADLTKEKHSDRVQPNQQQLEVLDKLKLKQEDDKKLIKSDEDGNKITTAFNYFIKVGTRFMSFIRVHGVIGSQYIKDAMLLNRQREIVRQLQNSSDIKAEIIKILNEYNKKLEEDYGKDSFEYKRYHIDLSMYTKAQMLTKNEIDNTRRAISEIVTNKVPGPAVIAGQIVDEIGRAFFAEEELINKPEYKMTDAIFKDTVKEFEKIQAEFVKRGWVVDTTPYTWYFTAHNGQRVAGETDLIAIDKDGNIHVLDFKTTKNSSRFKLTRLFKSKNSFTGEEVWQNIPDGLEAPKGAETRIQIPFFDENLGDRYQRNYAQQYARQLHMYRLMIQEQTGVKVTSLEILPFCVDYDNVGNDVDHMSTVQSQGIVNLNGAIVEDEFSALDNYLSKLEPKDKQLLRIKDKISELYNKTSYLYAILDADWASSDLKAEINEWINVYKDIRNKVEKNAQYELNNVEESLDRLANEYNDLYTESNNEYEQHEASVASKSADKEKQDLKPVDEKQSDLNWLDSEIEPVPEAGKLHWYQFNNLHSTIDFLKTIPHYLESIIKSDFIANSLFKVFKNDDGTFSVIITYAPKGGKVIKFSKSIRIRLGNELGNEPGSNSDVQSNPSNYSIMARNLIRQYKSLFNSLKPGEYIVAKNVKRTNGKLVYSEKDNSLMDTLFIVGESTLNHLLNGEDSLLGVVGSNGEIFEVSDTNRSTIGDTIKPDENGKPLPKGYTPVPGNESALNEHMPAGSVVFLYKFKYDEDPVDAPMRIVYITLRGKKFEQSDANLITQCLQQIAASQDDSTDTIFQGVHLYDGENEISNEISRISCQLILKLITRFGRLASYAGHEFIFQYAQSDNLKSFNPNKIKITNMEAEPVVDSATGMSSRPIIVLDISKPEDLSRLNHILTLSNMHINQVGIMRSKLNDPTGFFGNICNIFENTDYNITRIKFGDFEITREDYEQGLDFAGWMIKHGYAGTNAESLQNPLISITELEKTSAEIEKKKKEEDAKPVSDGGLVGVQQETKVEEKPAAKPEPKPEKVQEQLTKEGELTKQEPNKHKNDDGWDDASINQALDDASNGSSWADGNLFDDNVPGMLIAVDKLANSRLTGEQQKFVEKETKRLVGDVPLVFVEHELSTLSNGAKVAGMISTDTITLSKHAPEGAQYHEAFHRILELLVGEKRRKKIYQKYAEHYGAAFEKSHGRKLTERDVAEGLAEMFRIFMIDREHINIKWNNFWKISKIFKEIKEYIQALRALGDRKFAMLFIMANSGIFRYIKPKQANIERFINDFNGQMYLTISGKRYHTDKEGKRTSERVHIDLSEFPSFGGMQMFEEALDHIVSTIIQGYSIDMTASNAAKIVTDLSSMQKLFHGKESTEHSAFFRVLTGEYINYGMTVQDAIQYYKTNYGSLEIANLTKLAAAKVKKGDINALKKQILILIKEQEYNRKFEDLNQSQKMFAQLFDENNWDIIEQKINRRLKVLGIDSQLDRLLKQEDDIDDTPDDESGSYIGQEIAAHDDAFYTHDRSEDTTAAVRFMLSTIPDERFATEEDVKAGRVKSIENKDGSKVMIPNKKGILGFTGYIPRNLVKNLLLSACHDCKSAEDLLAKLHALSETEPVFYRLERKLNALMSNSIKKHDDGKYILIGKDGEPLKKNSYYQHNGEDGIYFTYADKEGKDTGNVINEYDYDVDTTSSEALATQLFNFVSCQKLDFMQVVFSQIHDEDGQPIDGKYTSSIKSSDSGYAASMFPKQWFTLFRTGVSGIFFLNKNGNFKFVKNGEEETGKALLKQALDTLGDIFKLYKTISKKHEVAGRAVDKNNLGDFIYIESLFLHALNILGIDISKPALEMALREEFNTIETGTSVQKAFGNMITSARQDLSFLKFIETVVYNKSGSSLCQVLLNKNQETINNTLMVSNKENLNGKNKEYASGINIYSDNAFVKWCAQAVSRYNKTSTDLMTNGPEGTKNYTMALRHTAYDMTEDINEGKYDKENDRFTGSKILKDSQKWNYCWSTRSVVGRVQKIGSLIMKHIASGTEFKLKLMTYNGARLDSDYQGGVKYTKTSEREDYVGKCGMLATGKIVFPTLSDKSTWFFIDGIKTPGIDYNNISNTQTSDLLHVTDINGELHIELNQYDKLIRLMIEYAFCERNAIQREIERNEEKNNPILNILNKIERVKDNRMRFGSLTKIARRNEKGEIEWLHLTGDEDPLYYLNKANEWFFGDNITDAQRTEMMTLTLEEGFYENLSLAEHCGAIVNDNEGVEKLGRLYTYKNVAFDSNCIDKLRVKYESELTPSGENITIENAAKARSLAVLAYMWDVYVRGIISEEEVERLYTGNPISYKWIYGMINGVKRLIDRHSDQTKRLGGLGSTGERNRPYMVGIRSKYKCAEVEDQMVVSKQLDTLKELFPDSEIRQLYYEYKSKTIEDQDELDKLADKIYGRDGVEEMSLEEIKKDFEDNGQYTLYEAAKKRGEDEASSFGLDKKGKALINVADGAAYITPKMAKNLLRQLGRYTKPVREAFEYLEGKRKSNILSNKLAFKVVYEAMLGAQKYSAYGYRPVGDVKIQYYNKFALFPLFKQMTTGYTPQILLKMESQHIDMLMMHSAVKIGSQSPALLTEDILNSKESFDKFQFDTYDQEYKFIRRQLNTDPHEKQFAQMGTQMTKVALTSLILNKEYITPNGEKLRGRELLKAIMSEINNLSTYGMEELEREMFGENKEKLDLDKFSRFLEEELESRDADENLIDGILVEVDKDGHKHFKVNLEAMSSIDWIQSILVAKLNKKIVDINVKGNAFYQRSVWGMEGKPTILGDDKLSRTINDGEDLKMVNEDGSMDAVISIDFFMDIIPEGLKNDFEASRKWLIDNKVIGKGAKANTIASRIPTQAQSSIHALRFVDVLPVVRDTIVLPKEFTMITGSDFDIDKLYLARLSYRPYKIEVEKDGKKISIDKVSTQFNKDSEDKSRNNLLNYYMTILKDHGKDLGKDGIKTGASSNISLRSIDADTDLVKNALKKIESNKQDQEEYAYKFGNIAFLVKTRGSFVVGKFGIGPFALNNNNLILTQLYDIKFDEAHCPLLRELGCLDLSSLKDKQGNLKLSWLSGLINAHVDVAKDPYVQRLNINTFTYNTTNLLIRTGMGERTFMFLSQPIMKELASVYEMAGGNYMEDVTLSKAARQRYAVINYILDNFKDTANTGNLKNIKKTLQSLSKGETEVEESISSFAKALFGINDDGSYNNEFEYIQDDGQITIKNGCILQDIFDNKEVLHNVNKELSFDNLEDGTARYRITVKLQNDNGELTDTQIDLSPKQVQLYVAYVNQAMSKYGLKLSDLVNSCKIDTKKQGKSFVEQLAFKSKYDDVFNNDDMLFEQYGLDRLKDESFIGTKTNNALNLYERIISLISLQGTKQYKDIHSGLMSKFHSSELNKDLSRKVSKYMMKAIKLMIFDNDILPMYSKERGLSSVEYAESLFFGDNTIQDQLLKILNKIRNDKKDAFSNYGANGIIINPLLKALQADVYQEREGYGNPKFIKLENAVLDDSDNANAIERAWDELYHDEEHYIEYGDQKITFKQFAENLFIYAFYTSGDTTGGTKFFKYAPNTIRIDSGYNKAMVKTLIDFENNQFQFNIDEMYSMICQNNWNDPQIVREFKTKRYKFFLASFYTLSISTKNVLERKTSRSGKSSFVTRKKSKTVNLMMACVRTNPKTGKKLATMKSVVNEQTGLEEFPLFIKVRQHGFDKYDPDNYILYKLVDTRPLDTANVGEGFYPIYAVTVPNSATLRAGSYNYDYIRPYGTRPVMYDDTTIEAINQFFSGKHLDSDKPFTEDTLVDKFVKLINNSPVLFTETELIKRLKEEFKYNEIDITQTRLQKYIEEYIDKDHRIKLRSDEKSNSKSDKKSDKKKTNDKIVNVHYGNNEHKELSNLAERKFTATIDGLGELEFNSVEGAILATKLLYTDEGKYIKEKDASGNITLTDEGQELLKKLQKVSDESAILARKDGKNIEGLKADKWNDDYDKLLTRYMTESFQLNEEAKKALLDTGDKTISHENSKGVEQQGGALSRILTKIRKDLNKAKSEIKEESLDEFKSRAKDVEVKDERIKELQKEELNAKDFAEKVKQLYYDAIKRSPKDIYNDFKAKLESLEKSDNLLEDKDEILRYMQALIDKYSKSEKESSEKKGKLDTSLDDDFNIDDDIEELKPIDLSHKDAELFGNTYNRPFTKNGILYDNVIQANYCEAVMNSSMIPQDAKDKILNELHSSSLYTVMRQILNDTRAQYGDESVRVTTDMMIDNMKESFKLNHKILKQLLNTGNAKIIRKGNEDGVTQSLAIARNELQKEKEESKSNDKFDDTARKHCKG